MTLNPTNAQDPASRRHELQNSFGPEATPYEQLHQQPPETRPEPGLEKAHHEVPVILVQTPSESKRTRILGLPAPVVWAVAALLSIAIVAISVGVAVGTRRGGSASSSSSSSSTSSPAGSDDAKLPTSTLQTSPSSGTASSGSPSATVTSGTQGLGANSCTFPTPRTHRTADGTDFMQYCSTDWRIGTDAANGRGRVTDVSVSVTYSFEQCMESCAKYNRGAAAAKAPCRAVTYNSNLTLAIEVWGNAGNCWLKNTKGIDSRVAGAASAAIESR